MVYHLPNFWKYFMRKFLTSLIISSCLIFTGCSSEPQVQLLSKNSTVIALGDSLTYGYGTNPQTAYPNILAQNTGWQVINAGVNGDTSQQVLARLDTIIAQKPKLVLLGIGGNDVLQRVNREITKQNIIQIIQKFKAQNIDVVLIAEPHFSPSALLGKASDNPIYAEIAKQENIPLFEDEWSRILSDKTLKSDQIHANTQGYAEFAENLQHFLDELGYL